MLLDQDGEREAAAKQAVRLAASMTLPVVARSLTHEELIGQQRTLVRWCVLGAAIITIGLIAAVWSELLRTPWKVSIIIAPALLLLGVPLLLIVRWHRRRARTYRDPQLSIRVEADGLTITKAGIAHAIPWSAIRATVECYSGRSGIQFVGATVQSPVGAFRLDNDIFENGRWAAVAIVGGLHNRRVG